MRITFELDDLNARSEFQQLQARVENLSPLMKSIAVLGKNRARQSFQNQTAPDGTPWKPSWRVTQLSEKKGRKGRKKGGKTLIDSSNLLKSLNQGWDNTTAVWGAGMEYGIVHQLGATIKPQNGKYLVFAGADGHLRKVTQVEIPARPFLPDAPDQLDQDAISDLINNFLTNDK
jgi:phage virion morphogenesis protein